MKYRVLMFVCDYWNGKTKQDREKQPWVEREFIVDMGWEFCERPQIEEAVRMAAEREITPSKHRLLTGLITKIEEVE